MNYAAQSFVNYRCHNVRRMSQEQSWIFLCTKFRSMDNTFIAIQDIRNISNGLGEIVKLARVRSSDLFKPRAESPRKGHVHVFMFHGTDWDQLGHAIIGDNNFERFGGSSLDLSDDRLIVAVEAHYRKYGGTSIKIGSVRVFKYDSNWEQPGHDIV